MKEHSKLLKMIACSPVFRKNGRGIGVCLAVVLFCFTANASLYGQNADAKKPRRVDLARLLDGASEPSKFFTVPTARALRSMEFTISAGSSFGVEGEGGGFAGRIGVGLGDVGEVALATSGVSNQLTGETNSLATTVFKVSVLPDGWTRRWFVPQVALQLKSTTWKPIVGREDEIRPAVREAYANYSLQSLTLESRFTTLFVIVGKEGALGAIQLGASLTDVRTRRGAGYFLHLDTGQYEWRNFEDKMKEIWAPFGGIALKANPKTRLMAEVQAIPLFDYKPQEGDVSIRREWLGLAGVRFFIWNWLSLDTGVRYQKSFKGIADTEINLGANLVLPVREMSN